jgi:hypothetical protein
VNDLLDEVDILKKEVKDLTKRVYDLEDNVVDDVLDEIKAGGFIELGSWTIEGAGQSLEIFKGNSGGTYFFDALPPNDDIYFPDDLGL